MKKTKELVDRGKADKPALKAIRDIQQASKMKLLGINFHSSPTPCDSQFDMLRLKAAESLHIVRICKLYSYLLDALDCLFNSLII